MISLGLWPARCVLLLGTLLLKPLPFVLQVRGVERWTARAGPGAPHMPVQGPAKRWVPGLVNFVPYVAYHFCLSWSTAFTKPGIHILAKPCKLVPNADKRMQTSYVQGSKPAIHRGQKEERRNVCMNFERRVIGTARRRAVTPSLVRSCQLLIQESLVGHC